MNNASYTKEQILSFPVTGLRLYNIPVLESARLSFYQKYIILLLEKGIKAGDVDELCEKLSGIINVSVSCVKEFVDYLSERSYISFDGNARKYFLQDSLHVTIKPEYDNAMFADTEVKKADCNKVVYVEGTGGLYLESDFSEDAFSRKGDTKLFQNDYLDEDIIESVCEHREKIEELVTRHFLNSNVHLQAPFSFELKENSYTTYTLEFPALVQYRYSSELKKSKREKTIIPESFFLPKEFVEQLSEKFDEDKELPRFIRFDEPFYQKISPAMSKLTSLEKGIDEVIQSISPLKDEQKVQKANLDKVKKEHKKQKNEKAEELKGIEKQMQSVSDEIGVYESAIANENDNEELIKNLKKTIEENQKEKEKLSQIIEQKEQEIGEIEKAYKEKEDLLTVEIEKKETEIATLGSKTKQYEKEFERLTQDCNQLFTDNKKYLNATVRKAIDKYPSAENILFRDISDIVVQIDSAISASENDAFDEMRRSLSDVRNRYRNAVKVAFDVLLQKNLPNLGSYYTDMYALVDVDNMFREKKIRLEIKKQMIIFHSLINAIGHLADNDPKKFENKKRIEDFKGLSKAEREKILVSVPSFFAEINFTKAEIKSMVEKLKV